jgi:hypothetical protein
MAREAIESIKIQFMKVLADYGVEESAPALGDKVRHCILTSCHPDIG